MKTKLLSSLFLAALAASVSAQDTYVAQKLSSSDLNGTARYVGMGGAMSALGGDISVMSSNPAGIGIFRHSEATITGSYNKLSGDVYKNSDSRVSLDNAGIVISLPYSNYSSLRYVNYGFAYRKKKSFYDTYNMGFALNDETQTDQVALLAKYNADSFSGDKGWALDNVGYWEGSLARLGLRGHLLHVVNNAEGTHIDMIEGVDASSAEYRRNQTGGISEFDFNVAFNIDEQLYLGATVGVYDVKYTRNSLYTEYPLDPSLDSYSISNIDNLTGTGVDLKLGAIFRPIEDSPFRFGVAIHTPTYYVLTDNTSFKVGDTKFVDLGDYEYHLQTPWKFNFSAGTIIGGAIAVGAEYEYEDFSAIKFRDDRGDDLLDLTDDARDALKGVGTVKIGAEARISPQFSVRAGYNHSTAAFKDDAYKNLYWDSQLVETQYDNSAATDRVSLGIGYRSGGISADIAYQYSSTKNTFFAFDGHSGLKNDYNRSQVMFTLGYSF